MNTPAALFTRLEDVNAFRDAVIEMEGEFNFEREDMLELGNVYFDRYPDCFSNRNCEHIQIGYQVTRICMVEKILNAIEGEYRNVYRQMFFNIGSIENAIQHLVDECGPEKTWEQYNRIQEETERVRREVDSLPTGMIKERFVGGITNLFNVLYLIKSYIRKQEQ